MYPPQTVHQKYQHTGSIALKEFKATVTSWSSWRSFTVMLLCSSGLLPLGNTPSLVMTTGWSTLKSRAMADTSDGARAEGSDAVTISNSASCPVAVDGRRAEHYGADTGEIYYSPDMLTASVKWWGTGDSERQRERGRLWEKLQHQQFEGAGSRDRCLQSEPQLVVSVVS